MKKKILSLALTLCMALSLLPTAALATAVTDCTGGDDCSHEAAIGTTHYDTLAEAVNAADDSATITLLKNVTLSTQLNIDKAITLDGNEKTITRTSSGSSAGEKAGILVTANATIKNLMVSGPNGTASGWDEGEFGIKVYNTAATLTDISVTSANAGIQINGAQVTMTGTIDVSGNEFGGIEVCHAGATLDLTEATLVNDDETANCPVLWNDDTKGTITQNEQQPLVMTAVDATKDHYYLSGVAQVGTTQYATLAEAVAAAGEMGDTVTLLKDVTGEVNVSANNTLTLDLNSKKITNEGGFGIVNNGKLTITGNGTIEAKYPVRNNADGSELVIENGTYISVEGAVTVRTTNSKVTINDGTFSASDNAVISSNGTAGLKGNTITINGGTFNGGITTSGYIACGIYAPNDDAVTVNDGTFNITGGAGIVARAGIVTVNGGTFNTTGTETGKVGDSRVVVPCSALVFDSDANYPGMTSVSKISVTGGNFDSANGKEAATVRESQRIAITGGTYSTDPGAYVAGGYAAALESDKYVVKGVQAAYTPHVDLSQSGGVKLTDSTFSGSVDTRTFTVTDSTIHTLYESILTGENPWKVANGKELTFATIKFGGLADESYYTVQQINPALAYAYSTTDFPDSTKTATYLGSDLKDGLCFPVSSQEGTITFKIAKASGAGVTADLTNAAVYTYTNNIAFTASDAPAETAPVIEVAPTVSGTTASATVAAETIASTVESANTETKVEITATTTNTNVNEAKVELPKEAVAALVDTTAPEAPAAKVAAVEVKTDVGTVTLSSSALETIATDSTVQSNGATVEVKQASAPAGAIAALEVTVKSNSSEVAIANLEQPITISFNIGTGKVNPVLLYSDDGVLKNIKSSSYDPETGIITGTTNHLTTFVAVDPMTTVPGGIGQKVTLTPNTTGHYLTIQVTYGNANSIYTVQANAAVEIYVANGTVLNVWETTAVPTFDAGSFAPNSNPTILVNSATISAS